MCVSFNMCNICACVGTYTNIHIYIFLKKKKCILEKNWLPDRKYFHEACRIFLKKATLNTTKTNAGFEWHRFKNRSLEATHNAHNVRGASRGESDSMSTWFNPPVAQAVAWEDCNKLPFQIR